MISEELSILKTKFEKSSFKMSFIEGVSEEMLVSFERKHDIHLPEEYKEWLKISDGGELFLPAGIQLYGITHKPLINVDDNDRPNDSYVVIGSLSSGDPILFEKNGRSISIYNHDAGRIESDEVYSDFVSFLKDLKNILGVEG